MKETFIDPLLHPYSTSYPSPASPTTQAYDEDVVDSPRESIEHLPIASRFLSPTPFRSDSPSAPASAPAPPSKDDPPNIDGESLNSDEEDEAEDRMGQGLPASASRKAVHMSLGAKHNHPRSPYGMTVSVSRGGGKYGTSVPFPSRSHHSLPPPPRINPMAASTQSLGRQSVHEKDPGGHHHPHQHHPGGANTNNGGNNPLNSPRPSTNAPSTRVFRKFKKSNPNPAAAASAQQVLLPGAVPPALLPEDLRKCLEVIEGGILDGHIRLSESLRSGRRGDLSRWPF